MTMYKNKYKEAFRLLFDDYYMTPKHWEDYETLKELIDKQEKYRWHNSKDQNYLLPSYGSRVLVKYITGGYDLVMFYDSYFEKAFNEFIEGWKYIEEFEDE